MGDFAQLHYPTDSARVLDLCKRARDYVQLETGMDPDEAYVRETMTEAPPAVPPDQVWCWGSGEGALDGIATYLKGYYEPDDWYLGLLLLDPAVRGGGLGTRMARHVIAQARADNATCLRIAVLDTNPKARAFWVRLGFAHEKSTQGGDGQLRHVHRLPLDKDMT